MPKRNPEEVAQTWASRISQSGDRVRQGIQGVTVPPGQAAARQKQAYVQRVAARADKWASRVSSVPLAEWQQAAIEKGIPRIASGAQAAQGKMASFMGQLLPYIDSQVSSLPPRGDLEANIARATAFVRGMAKFQRR